MRRSLLWSILPCCAFAAVLASSREALAGPFIGVDLDLGTAFQRRVDFSYGLGARVGYKFHFAGAPLWILPEAGGHFMRFGTGNDLGPYDHAGAAFGGVRFGGGDIVQPNVFAHLGLGFVGSSALGPHADIGAGIDFQITRLFSLGIQAAYNSITVTSNGDAAKWVSFGLNLGFDLIPHRHRRHR
ncbi:Hypothetical protein A7982_00806 [Minicystis rosea]|nr:Hypothetical protein A7982_00806 [Minicystis rosea]